MTDKPLVIIHGWSDHAQSFTPMARALKQRLGKESHHIILADYISLDDRVTFADVCEALQHAWLENGLPTSSHSVDMLTHSTGALVGRLWLQHFYTAKTSPIARWVMLAPANFGSPLAHKGRAFWGRVVKGLGHGKPFQVGSHLLRGLELASPLTWELAMQDRLGEDLWFGEHGMLATVLVGNHGYSGLAAAANEEGTDGTVRVATANLNCAYLQVDLADTQLPRGARYQYRAAAGKTAFGLIAGHNHSSIVSGHDGAGPDNEVLDAIEAGLTLTAEDFDPWCTQWDAQNTATLEQGESQLHTQAHQHTVFRVRDQWGQPVDDYFVEFSDSQQFDHWFAEAWHADVLRSVHAYAADSSYRSLYLNYHALMQHYHKEWQHLHVSLSAQPELDRGHPHALVGYPSIDDDPDMAMVFDKTTLDHFLAPNRTLLVDVTLPRRQRDEVMRLVSA